MCFWDISLFQLNPHHIHFLTFIEIDTNIRTKRSSLFSKVSITYLKICKEENSFSTLAKKTIKKSNGAL